MMDKVTDIWFRSGLSLEEITTFFNGKKNALDAENYWEWIVFGFEGHPMDITRTHKEPAAETDTRIFLLGSTRYFSDELIEKVCRKLTALKVNEIYLGSWVYATSGDEEFDKVVVRKWK
jgi:hypothetical protein